MKPFLSRLAVAFAIANLYLLSLSGPLVSPGHQLVFHLPGSATALFIPVILDLLALTGLLFLLLTAAKRHPRTHLLLWAILLLPLPVALLEAVASFAGRPANLWLLTSLLFLTAAALAFLSARLSALTPAFRRAEPALITLLSFVSLSGLVLLAQLLWNGWQTRHLNPPFVSQSLAHPAPNQLGNPKPPFVLWVILDELSYDQIFANRQPGLALPNLDHLAAQSAVLTQVIAAAEFTRIAVPSLLTGLPLTATNPTADGQHLLLHPRGARHWQTLDPAGTVFADAAHAGLPTAIAGWYEPYCRLLPAVLDRCFWTYRDQLPGGLAADASLGTNMLAPLRDLAEEGSALLDAGRDPQNNSLSTDREGRGDVQRHAADYRELYAAADRMLQAQNAGLLLLHMPIPHPWGFYDRRTGTFPPHRTTYLDNLVLADLYLGHLRAEMQADGTWDNAIVIVMGDHGWRAGPIWRHSGFWTREEEQASRKGTLQDRPAMLVKLAHQQSSIRINSPFAAFRTRALLDAILSGDLKKPESLSHWIAVQPAGNIVLP